MKMKFIAIKGVGILPLVMVLAATGCEGMKTGNLSGKVTFQDKPLPGGYLNIYSIGADGKVSAQKSAAISENGDYTAPRVPIGEVKITVQAPLGALEPNMSEKGGMPKRGKAPIELPPGYTNLDTTQLKYTVTPGDQKYDVTMK
jgi:hypothetical protein